VIFISGWVENYSEVNRGNGSRKAVYGITENSTHFTSHGEIINQYAKSYMI